MNYLLLGLAAPVGLIGLFIVTERLIQTSIAGLLLVVTAVLYGLVADTTLLLSFGGTNVSLNDVVYSLLLVAALARLLRSPGLHPFQLVLLLFSLVMVGSLVRGALVIEPNGAIAEFRKYHTFLAAALYFSTVPRSATVWDRLGTYWLRFAGGLALLGMLRWLALGIGLSGGVFGSGDSVRVLASGETLVLAQALLISMVAWGRSDLRLLRLFAPVLLAAVILLQHRTVWMVALVCLAVRVLRDRQLGRQFVGLIGAAVVAVGVLSFTVLDADTDPLAGQLSDSATDVGTWEWRYEGWRALLVDTGPDGPVEWVFGKPFGSGFERSLGRQVVDVSPHNFYVETFLRGGLLGLAVLLVLYFWPMWVLWRPGGRGVLFTNQVLFTLALTFVLFSIPYSPRPEQGVLFGLLLAAAGQQRHDDRHPQVAPSVVAGRQT